MMQSILPSYGLPAGETAVEAFGTGLINHTWKVTARNEHFILQKVNDSVFKNPAAIAENTRLLNDYLEQHYPQYQFAAPLKNNNGSDLIYVKDDGYYRLFAFVKGSHSTDVVATPQQAYEAARQFGKFTRLLSGFDVEKLNITIPQFHDLNLRYTQFLDAVANGNKTRIIASGNLIEELQSQREIVEHYKNILVNPAFKKRVTHHDTKISNVLFDSENKSLCVIDLDTVMPGYFISDVGDMIRTYVSPASEEETDLNQLIVREAFFMAIVDGYLSEMKDELSAEEQEHFIYAGKFMIYMQALRFLTDHLNDDVYYGAKYEGHNYSRAMNQAVLLRRLMEKENELQIKTHFNNANKHSS